MTQATLEAASPKACLDMECGLARDNVEHASELISQGNALLKITIYPWGAEFDLVQRSTGMENLEANSNDGV